jgi:small acid-soluble spore protein H (minor)
MNKKGYEANTKLIKNWGGKKMDVMRVKQILSSSAEIEVKYHGASVWIDQLHEDGRTATVHLRGPLEERSTVDISDLSEG